MQDLELGVCRPATGGRLDQHTPLVAIPGGMACDGDDGIADDLYFCTLVERQPSADGEDLLQMRSVAFFCCVSPESKDMFFALSTHAFVQERAEPDARASVR